MYGWILNIVLLVNDFNKVNYEFNSVIMILLLGILNAKSEEIKLLFV